MKWVEIITLRSPPLNLIAVADRFRREIHLAILFEKDIFSLSFPSLVLISWDRSKTTSLKVKYRTA